MKIKIGLRRNDGILYVNGTLVMPYINIVNLNDCLPPCKYWVQELHAITGKSQNENNK